MKALLLILLSVPSLAFAQLHQRYEIAIPDNVAPPFVAELSAPADGKVVSLSPGGNVNRSSGRISWGAVTASTSMLWFEMVFPDGVNPSEPGALVVIAANGSTTNLTPTTSSIANSALALLATQDTHLNLSADGDEDGLSLLLEHMLGLSDRTRSDVIRAFSVVSEPEGFFKLTAPIQLLDGYDLILRPVLETGDHLPEVILASSNQTADGRSLEISGLRKAFFFKISVLSPAD